MNWATIVVLTLLAGYILSETVLEGFVSPQRSDIGLSANGWGEAGGYKRDLRYSEAFVDIQGLGVATDFCRTIYRTADPDTLRVSCALGRRDGMSTTEYNGPMKKEGFRFSRDDYWAVRQGQKRMDYCRILKDDDTGEWFAGCAVAGPDGFKRCEERDPDPPTAIQGLLEAYEGILVWFRWLDDRDDYAGNAAFSVHGTPVFPTMLKPDVSRGLQLNRWPAASQAALPPPPLRDYLRWGEKQTFELHQTIQPRQMRAIACWVWWDSFEKRAKILECKNPNKAVGKMDRIALGIEGGGADLLPIPTAHPAQELRPETIMAIGQMMEPLRAPVESVATATYFFEIWDKEHRIMRLHAPMGSAKTGEWQHVVVTTTDSTTWWPTWQMWINGVLVAEKTDGRMSPAMELRENYIGQGMRGCIQDFRMYSSPLTPAKLRAAMAWTKPRLHPLP